jgi:hypothetical protein
MTWKESQPTLLLGLIAAVAFIWWRKLVPAGRQQNKGDFAEGHYVPDPVLQMAELIAGGRSLPKVRLDCSRPGHQVLPTSRRPRDDTKRAALSAGDLLG